MTDRSRQPDRPQWPAIVVIAAMIHVGVLPGIPIEASESPQATATGDVESQKAPEEPTSRQIEHCRTLAEKGDAQAQCSLGVLYLQGRGVPQDPAEAERWFLQAADRGDRDAQFYLGVMYIGSPGVEPDAIRGLALVRRAAAAGHPRAQGLLGVVYWQGTILPQDRQKGSDWIQQAADSGDLAATHDLAAILLMMEQHDRALATFKANAERGHAESKKDLGLIHYLGMGVGKNLEEAVRWYRAAASDGNTEAMAALGQLYFDGEGVPRDLRQAFEWFLAAAEGDHPGAQVRVGVMAYLAQGTDRDVALSQMWLERAARSGENIAVDLLDDFARGPDPRDVGDRWTAQSLEVTLQGMRIMSGEFELVPPVSLAELLAREIPGEAQYPDSDRAADNRLGDSVVFDAFELEVCRELAEAGNAVAQHNLGSVFSTGQGVTQDVGQAMQWYRKASEQGFGASSLAVGRLYANGHGVPLDMDEAVRWFEKAAEQGEVVAQRLLGGMYMAADGVPRDDRKAVKWYTAAAEQGDPDAQNSLAFMHHVGGIGVSQNMTEAARWFRAAAEQGVAEAQYMLGSLLARGEGVTKDAEESARWHKLAIEQGYEPQGPAQDLSLEEQFLRVKKDAEENGRAETQLMLGWALRHGFGTDRDLEAAAEWILKAAEQGLGEAQLETAVNYLVGLGVTVDREAGREWLRRAEHQGHPRAGELLAALDRKAVPLGEILEALGITLPEP